MVPAENPVAGQTYTEARLPGAHKASEHGQRGSLGRPHRPGMALTQGKEKAMWPQDQGPPPALPSLCAWLLPLHLRALPPLPAGPSTQREGLESPCPRGTGWRGIVQLRRPPPQGGLKVDLRSPFPDMGHTSQ